MLEKKSMVLNSVDNNEQKALLNMECDGTLTRGNVRLYSFSQEPKGIISLGIFTGQKVIKAGLTKVSNMLYSFQTEMEKIPGKFSCAVVNFVQSESFPLLYGASEGGVSKETILDNVIEQLQETKNVSEIESVLDEYDIDFDDKVKDEIEEEINKNITDEDISICAQKTCNCEDCEYKKYYLNRARKLSSEEEDVKNFYEDIKGQIDKIFSENSSEKYLEELLPNSKFVRVNMDENDYYVLGLIYENEEIKYICYGVPGVYQSKPPKQLSGYPIWFPIDKSNEEGFGYWLTYQDAESGESVKATIV